MAISTVSSNGIAVGGVSASNLAPGAAIPSGALMMWPTSSAPSGWLVANGAAVSRATYATLFAVLGTTFGSGDGSTTFNLPDYRDRMPIGAGTSYSANSTGGSKDAVVVSHTHTASVTDPGHRHTQGDSGQYDFGIYGGASPGVTSTNLQNGQNNTHPYTSTEGTGISVSNSTAGVSGTNANLPPYLGIYFIVKT